MTIMSNSMNEMRPSPPPLAERAGWGIRLTEQQLRAPVMVDRRPRIR